MVTAPLRKCRFLGLKSALSVAPPKADMCGATRDVRFGPIADILIGRLSPKEEPRDAGL